MADGSLPAGALCSISAILLGAARLMCAVLSFGVRAGFASSEPPVHIRRNACRFGCMDKPQVGNPAAANIRAIVELERKALATARWSDRVSDAISAFAGSLWFVLCHIVLFTAWATWNAVAPSELRFDPYPYGLLTFIVSLEGVLIATFVLIKQNRMSAQSDQRDHLNLQVDLLAEQEMTLVIRMLRRISDRIGVEPDDSDDVRTAKLAEETNVYELMQTLEHELPAGTSGDTAPDTQR